jgi:glycosyltransferase involved in cell wall biosynthesis
MPTTLSVVIANYNHGIFLPTSLEAFRAQTKQPIEIIVVDDASTDNSLDVLANFKERMPNLKIIRLEKNQGVEGAFNTGIAAATGDFVYLAGADDRVAPRLVEATLSILDAHPKAGLCCGIGAYLEESDRVWRAYIPCDTPTYYPPKKVADISAHPMFHIASWTISFHRETFLKWGGMQPDLAWNSDWFGAYLCAFEKGLCYVPEVLGYHRLSVSSHGAKAAIEREKNFQIFALIMSRLKDPAYDQVRPFFLTSGVIGHFPGALRAAFSSPDKRQFRSRSFLINSMVTWARINWHRWIPGRLRPFLYSLIFAR